MNRIHWLVCHFRHFALAVIASTAMISIAQSPSIVMASTTSTEQSGLFGHLLPAFKLASGIDVKVVAVGTGQAIDMGRRGDADMLFVHDQAAEEKFVADGFSLKRYLKLDEKLSAGSGDYIWGLAFAPNAPSTLATADSDGYITIWDLASCTQVGTTGTANTGVKELNCHPAGVKARWQASKQAIRSIAFSEDGKLLVSGGDDGRLMAWWLTPEYQLDRVKSPLGQEIYHSDRKINSIDLKTIDRGVAIVTGSEDFQVKLHQLMN